MGILVSNVTTRLVVLSNRLQFWKKLAEATDPMTDRHRHDGPSQGLVSKHLENLKLGTENRLSELRDGMAGRTVTGVTDRHRPFREIESLNSKSLTFQSAYSFSLLCAARSFS